MAACTCLLPPPQSRTCIALLQLASQIRQYRIFAGARHPSRPSQESRDSRGSSAGKQRAAAPARDRLGPQRDPQRQSQSTRAPKFTSTSSGGSVYPVTAQSPTLKIGSDRTEVKRKHTEVRQAHLMLKQLQRAGRAVPTLEPDEVEELLALARGTYKQISVSQLAELYGLTRWLALVLVHDDRLHGAEARAKASEDRRRAWSRMTAEQRAEVTTGTIREARAKRFQFELDQRRARGEELVTADEVAAHWHDR